MILHYFKNKENKDKEIADFIYVNIINCSKNILNSKLNEINKGLNISFEISSIILISIFIGSKKRNLKDWKNINQELMNIFTRDFRSFHEIFRNFRYEYRKICQRLC